MSSYMQMGHDTQNLVGEDSLEGFAGIVLSPVNRAPTQLAGDVPAFRERGSYDILLDPQLYMPRSDRGHLAEHPYYPKDFDSADQSALSWWDGISKLLADYARRLGVDATVSPAFLPRVWSDDYYSLSVDIASSLCAAAGGACDILQTVIVDLALLGEPDAALRIASIASKTSASGFYVIVECSQEPRRELTDPQGMAGAMHLIHLLVGTGKPVIVAYASSDMILYKAAGATHCGTGKFFNLRRFTRARFEEPSQGGGQLPYWFEQALLAFLREADILLLENRGRHDLLEEGHSANVWAERIIQTIGAAKGKAWLKLGWCQYLAWFWQTEAQLNTAPLPTVEAWLATAERRWLLLEDEDILLSDPRNDGSWIRPWRQAVSEFKHRLG
jgi:hypothetical protein